MQGENEILQLLKLYNFGSLKSLKTFFFFFLAYASDMEYIKSFWNESLEVSYTALKVIVVFPGFRLYFGVLKQEFIGYPNYYSSPKCQTKYLFYASGESGS